MGSWYIGAGNDPCGSIDYWGFHYRIQYSEYDVVALDSHQRGAADGYAVSVDQGCDYLESYGFTPLVSLLSSRRRWIGRDSRISRRIRGSRMAVGCGLGLRISIKVASRFGEPGTPLRLQVCPGAPLQELSSSTTLAAGLFRRRIGIVLRRYASLSP